MEAIAMSEAPTKQRRGFALMTPERLKLISRAGGKRAQAIGRAHQFSAAEARAAGRKGGLASALARAARARVRDQGPEWQG